jgi:hypothetical protein
MTLRFDRRPARPVCLFAAAIFLGLSGSAAFAQNAAPNGAPAPGKVDDAATLTRFLDPLNRPKDGPEVAIDVTAAPDVKPWAEKAAALVKEWFPHVCQLLATENYTPPKEIRLIFKPDISAPAYASGNAITVNATWIRQHPDDFGMMIHEMTHLIQRYPGRGNKPGWLVEGIADYIRWWRFEPEAPRTRVNPDRAKYTDSYRTTAAFLAWAVAKYDRGLVRKLDAALREEKYTPGLFEQATGKTLDVLWEEYITAVRAAAAR